MSEPGKINNTQRFEVFENNGESRGTVTVKRSRNIEDIKRALGNLQRYYNNGLYDPETYARRGRVISNTLAVLNNTGRNPYLVSNPYSIQSRRNNRRG